jgi:fructose-specific component phosphotransferase system IIB-like protein
LRGTHLVVLDEQIGGLSAFELHLILRAAAKEDNVTMPNEVQPGISHCILLDPIAPDDEETKRMKVFACWVAGFDLCFIKPVVPREFEGLARRLREGMARQE